MYGGRWQDRYLEVGQVDHTITDPPYTDHVSFNQRRSTGRDAEGVQGISDTDLTFEGLHDLEALAVTALFMTRRWILIWCAVEQLGEYCRTAGGMRNQGGGFIRSGAWKKTNPTPQFTGDRPGMWGEGCAILHPPGGKMRWNGGGLPAFWEGPYERQDRFHETQKPLWLMQAQIRQFTEPGDLVWDPYAGLATTGVAALLEGRRFVGHEMNDEYFDLAVQRLRATERGTTLEAAQAGQMTILDVIK